MPPEILNNQIEEKFKELHLRLDDFYKEQFKYYQNDQKAHEDLREMIGETNKSISNMSDTIQPVVKLFDKSTTVASFSIWLLKGFGFLAGIITAGYAAFEIIKKVK